MASVLRPRRDGRHDIDPGTDPGTVSRLSRRRFLVGAVVTTVVAACGDDSDDGAQGTDSPRGSAAPQTSTASSAPVVPTTTEAIPAPSTSPSSAPTPTTELDTGSAAFPRTVTHGLGETTIPSAPTRIVATADRDQLDVLLAMGIRPVQYGLSGDYRAAPPWIDAAELEDVEAAQMADAFVPNLELIASARPDLILDAWSDPDTHAALAAIAPTVQIKTDVTDSWESAQRLAGEACGTEDAAEAAIADTRAVIAEQAARIADHTGSSVAVAFVLGDQLGMLTGTDIGGRIVSELGFEVVTTPDGVSGNYSLEAIPELLGSADIILSFDYGGLDAQHDNALFRALPAVAAGRYVSVPSDVASACYQESSLSLRWAASRVADALLAAANGEGIHLDT